MEKSEIKNTGVENYKLLALQLDELQKRENNGRGISCVRSIVGYLNQGQIENAKSVCLTEIDKIRNYPQIEHFIASFLFKNEKDIQKFYGSNQEI